MSSRPESGSPSPGAPAEPIFEVFCSRHFTGWLAEARLSLSCTTYQAGKLFLLGLNRDGRLSVFNRTLSRCMGLWGDGQTLYLSTLFQLWRFENSLEPGDTYQGYDRLYVPRVGLDDRGSGYPRYRGGSRAACGLRQYPVRLFSDGE